jgi:signal peptidase complex subunit 1
VLQEYVPSWARSAVLECSPWQIIAFLVGYMSQDILLTLYVGLAGTALTFLAVVPPWPFYNKNPEPWLSPHKVTSNISIDVDGQKVG